MPMDLVTAAVPSIGPKSRVCSGSVTTGVPNGGSACHLCLTDDRWQRVSR